MTELIFAVTTANIVIFSALGAATWSAARRQPAEPLAGMVRAVSVVSWTFVLGAATQLALVTLRLRWLPSALQDFVTGPWHMAQSLSIIGAGAALVMGLWRSARMRPRRSAPRNERVPTSAPQ